MKVSIITATYNSAATINDTLASLESQTYPDIEYIIVDGSSKDNTLEVIKNSCTRVSKIISEPDRGIYDALNKGIAAATGDIIGFLHSDDLFAYPGAIQDMVGIFQSGGYDAVYADLEYVQQKDVTKVVRLWQSGSYNKKKLKYGWMPAHPTFYMKRSCYEKLGDFDLSYNIAADYDSILRYLWWGNVNAGYLPKVLIKMRVGGISNRSLASILRKTREDIQAMRNNGLFWPLTVALKNLSKIPQFLVKKS
ncbi:MULTISPECIES: glycosyltransferase family 2 protein [Aeromonas]|uniref:Colanic acid biosynthesis glycosyl transferase n=1 Tax=Aeromonas hydrophila TaxID=644 RepID=X5CR95_AERHY|nr:MULTISPECIES: glycosyltransferase family 2 protein [Aeromonas]AHW40513.1 colanic acid biosynthesis glycosyl transferase [Aeromonas hydrophila]AHW40540.1 colanic acid biosynthesis glycosyl transferase [Aeromonas hydrophila]AID70985.1 colanic acid biosynthesis glycosyl transferase [Aeromonas hydrophila]AID71088.1 colanic acid biosynthesis glycosyl transferase [Aeromonas hydrophila]AID71115.1 colanic acid biosynthesis glycosyl transferase [Aeromonas hydrophila]